MTGTASQVHPSQVKSSLTVTMEDEIGELRRLIVSKLEELILSLTLGPDSADSVTIDELESIQGYVLVLDSVCRVPEAAIASLSSARRLLERQTRTETKPPLQRGDGAGRPRYEITRQQIEMFLKANFTVPSIASVLHVGKRTIERRMQEYNLSVRAQYTDITDDKLDEIVLEIKKVNPNCGSKVLIGYLSSKGIRVPRDCVRDSLARVDPLGIAARRCQTIHRRSYDITRPLALWHFDGNHKLVKWRFVVHGCIDGYSRIPVYLSCCPDNKASTVYSLFQEAVGKWGLPSRTRCDQGSENVDVVQQMLLARGVNRGSALVGRSVHNQRIERLWRDVFKDVLSIFYDLFTLLEDIGILDPLSERDAWCLQFAFLEHIDHRLKQWADAWIRHPLSSVGNKTPLQLWIEGSIAVSEHGVDPPSVNDTYGIDWNGPIPLEDDNVTVDVPSLTSPMNDEELLTFVNENLALLQSSKTEDKLALYKKARNYVANMNAQQ